jgi:hypothetical protein
VEHDGKKTVIENGLAINAWQNTRQCRISLQASTQEDDCCLNACIQLQLCEYQNYWWYTKLQSFSFFITYAEMCSECKIDRLILPLIKSFQMRLKLPKVNFIFYEYFFKAVVGDGNWK